MADDESHVINVPEQHTYAVRLGSLRTLRRLPSDHVFHQGANLLPEASSEALPAPPLLRPFRDVPQNP